MKVTEIHPNIFQFHYEKWRTLVRAFLRFQEHYESPIFRDQVFTFEEHKKRFTEEFGHSDHEGDFGYFGWWGGFNFPSTTLQPFLEGKFDPLSKEEIAALRVLKRIPAKRFYVIGTHGADPSDLEHELAHGFYDQSSSYKAQMDQAIASESNYFELMTAWLKRGGYHPAVFLDEMQAYAIYPDLADQVSLLNKETFQRVHLAARSIFDRHRLQLSSSKVN